MPGHRWAREVLTRFAGTAVVLAVVGLSMHYAGDDRTSATDPATPPSTSAPDVRTRVSNALSSMRTLSGEISIECAAGAVSCATPAGERLTRRWSFVSEPPRDPCSADYWVPAERAGVF